MATFEYSQAVNQYYGRQDLGSTILAGLQAAGKNLNKLTYDDLALVDQFHIRGKEATLKLASLAELRNDLHVIGCGWGLRRGSSYPSSRIRLSRNGPRFDGGMLPGWRNAYRS
jgi:hypothetical protein